MLYMAYGSNLDVTQIQDRCPNARYIGKSSLAGYKLVFNRHATIVKSKGSVVPIVVFDLTDEDIVKMDMYEGVHSNTYKKHYLPIIIEDLEIQALCYIKDIGKRVDPDYPYVKKILSAYKFWNFDLKFPDIYARLTELLQLLKEEYEKDVRYSSYDHFIRGRSFSRK